MKGSSSMLLALLVAAPLQAEESAGFLKIGVGARALGMGGAHTAIADDVSAVFWNPAGLSLLSKRELGAMHAQLTEGMSYNFFGYSHPAKYGTFGAGIMHLSQGSLQGRDANGRLTGGFSASDSAFSLSFGRKAGPNLGLGITTKLIRSHVANRTGDSVAFDLGGLYRLHALGPGVPSLGLSVQNMGPELSLGGRGAPLPLTFAAGLSYALPIGMTIEVDLKRRPYSGATEASFGTEYAVMRYMSLRAGYASNHGPLTGGRGVSDLSGLAAGFGLRSALLSLDYSITPYGGLGNAHRISLGTRW